MDKMRLLANLVPDRALIPEYLSTDYDTFIERVIKVLRRTEQFKDYNFEGSNIRLLIELQAYQSQLNMFYANKIAKNVYDDTADLYENLHRIAKMKGYNARGYISAYGEIVACIAQQDQYGGYNYFPGDVLYISADQVVYGTLEKIQNKTLTIPFTVDKAFFTKVPVEEVDPDADDYSSAKPDEYADSEFNEKITYPAHYITIPVIQGSRVNYTYRGSEIVNNKLILPFYHFNHDSLDDNDASTVRLSVNGVPWTRVATFYDYMSGLTENNITNNVYMLTYDKFKRYVIEFSGFRNVPTEIDTVELSLYISMGAEGNLGKNFIRKLNDDASKLVYNYTQKKYISLKSILITNSNPTQGGGSPQTAEEITAAGKGFANAQDRTVTKSDYVTFLKARSDVINAYVWGEKEVWPKGHTSMYNKLYISIMPSTWSVNSIQIETVTWELDGLKCDVIFPKTLSKAFEESLKIYLEPRKMLTVYEEFVVPRLIYFAFKIGLKIKRTYNFVDVSETVRSKLNYYFSPYNRKFHEKIDFKEIHNYLLNVSQVAEGYDWSLIGGVDNIVFREISLFLDPITQTKIDFYKISETGGSYVNELGETVTIDIGYEIDIKSGANVYPPNREGDYPQYTRKEYMESIENKMKVIELGFNQFPMLAYDVCTFEEEL